MRKSRFTEAQIIGMIKEQEAGSYDCRGLGADAPNLSGDTVLRLRKVWAAELSAFEKRDLSARNYVYIWADGVYFQAPMEQESIRPVKARFQAFRSANSTA